MYNEETKKRFLEEFIESTRVTYSRIFEYSEPMEELLGKDLYDFNLEEIEDILFSMNPKTFHSSHGNGRMVTSYISWAIGKGLRSHSINPLKSFGPDYFKKFVDDNLKLFISESELRRIEDACINAQDAVILRLLFEGVNGTSYYELRTLKKDAVSFDHSVLTLTNEDGTKRELKVSDRTLNLIEKAIKEKVYYKNNGEGVLADNVRDYADLAENDYVLRPSITRVNNPFDPVSKSVVSRRVRAIADFFDLPYLVANSILKSGMIFMAKNLIKNDGMAVGTKMYRVIAKRFAVNNFYSLKLYVTKENIVKLYPELWRMGVK